MAYETDSKRGVQNHFGARKTNQKFGGASLDGSGRKYVARWRFNYDDLPAGATSNLGVSIPANSTILSAKLNIITAFASSSSTTDLTVGLEQADGTDIDLDGLITAAQATQTTIAVANSVIDGASGTAAALINTTIGSAAGELVVTPTVADLTAGRAELVVEYLLPAPTQNT